MTYYEPDLYDIPSPSTQDNWVEEWSVVYVDKYGNTIQQEDEEIDDPWMTQAKRSWSNSDMFNDKRISLVDDEEEYDDHDTPYWWGGWWSKKKKKKQKSSYYADTYYSKYNDKKPTTYYGGGYNSNKYYGRGTNYNSHNISTGRTFQAYDYSDIWNKFSWSIVSNENRILLKKNYQKVSLERLSPGKVTVSSMNQIHDIISVYKNKRTYTSVGAELVKWASDEIYINRLFDDVIDQMPMQTDVIDALLASCWATAVYRDHKKLSTFAVASNCVTHNIYDRLMQWNRDEKVFNKIIQDLFINKSITLAQAKAHFPDLKSLDESSKQELDSLMSMMTKWESGWNPISNKWQKELAERNTWKCNEIASNTFNGFGEKRNLDDRSCSYNDRDRLYDRAVQAMRSKFKPRDIVSKEACLNKGKRINRNFLTGMSYKPLQAKTVEEHKRKKLLIVCDSSWSMSDDTIAWVAGSFLKALVDTNIFQIDHIIKHSCVFVQDYLDDYRKLDPRNGKAFYNARWGGEWFESLDDNIDVRYVKEADYVIVITDLCYDESAEAGLHRMLQRSKKHLVLVFGDRKWSIKWMNTRNISTIDNMINAVTTILAH